FDFQYPSANHYQLGALTWDGPNFTVWLGLPGPPPDFPPWAEVWAGVVNAVVDRLGSNSLTITDVDQTRGARFTVLNNGGPLEFDTGVGGASFDIRSASGPITILNGGGKDQVDVGRNGTAAAIQGTITLGDALDLPQGVGSFSVILDGSSYAS